MHVVHIASEMSPFAKVGGLADVVFGLSKALVKKKIKTSVILPCYPHLKESFFDNQILEEQIATPYFKYRVYKKIYENISIYGIEFLEPIFERKSIYGGQDEHLFFLYFSLAASDFSQKIFPDILHGHDWQACFALFDQKKRRAHTKTVLTLHNLEYQGKISKSVFSKLGYIPPFPGCMNDLDNPELVNLLKVGIESSDRITTVSRSYHDEILNGQGSFGLEKVLSIHRHKFIGILNGIDLDYFNPFTDPLIDYRYPKEALQNPTVLKNAKLKNLEKLLESHEKPSDSRFTVCCISRLATQKAPFLILYAMKKTLEMGGRFILVGSLHGCCEDEKMIEILSQYKDNPHLICELNTNAAMAQRTYASSHAIIVPSLFEPCGLTQMIALRYGTIPMVRATGGLKDTVFDIDTASVPMEKRNGYSFDYPDEGGIDWVLTRAFKLYNQTPDAFFQLAYQGFLENHGWDKSCDEYIDIYTILKEIT